MGAVRGGAVAPFGVFPVIGGLVQDPYHLPRRQLLLLLLLLLRLLRLRSSMGGCIGQVLHGRWRGGAKGSSIGGGGLGAERVQSRGIAAWCSCASGGSVKINAATSTESRKHPVLQRGC